MTRFLRPSASRSRLSFRPCLEPLETRETPSASTLDPRFNGVGHRSISLLGATDSQTAAAVAVQPDGKIVVAGTFRFNDGAASDFAVARFNNDGSLDSSFGNGGRTTIDFGFATNDEQATCMALQDDGKIVIGGFATFSGQVDFIVARLTGSGELDSTFDIDGRRRFDFAGGGTNEDQCFAIALQFVAGARKIVLAGSTDQTTAGTGFDFGVVRLNDSGSVDTSFHKTLGATDIARAVAIDSLNRIVVGGFTSLGATTISASCASPRRAPMMPPSTADCLRSSTLASTTKSGRWWCNRTTRSSPPASTTVVRPISPWFV
jgi:uncharacterized delta-60 repeat protein